jgi:protein-disulfide isomerase
VSKRGEVRRRKRGESGGNRSSRGRLNVVLIGVGVLALLIVVWNLVFSTGGQGARQPVEIAYGSTEELVEMAQGVELGNPDAPVTIMDFSDYQCPSCQAFATQVKPFLQMDFIDEGLANFVYYDFSLPQFPHSFLAARAARCAGDQDRYWPYHDRLFQSQREWSGQSDPFSTFVGYAEDLALDRGEFRSCLGSDRHAETVSANIELGRRLGVSGTPTIFLDTGEGRGERVQDWSAGQLRPQIREALSRLGYGDRLPDAEGGEDVTGAGR